MSPLAMVVTALLGADGAPLVPDGDEARRQLRRELARPEYLTDDPLQRLLDWLGRLVDDGVGAARSVPSVAAAAAVLATLLLVTGAVLLVSRAGRSARARNERRPVLGAETVSADELRRRSESALAAGRHDDALVDAFRALAVRQVERGLLPDLPQSTAHEVARTLALAHPGDAVDLRTAAAVFDEVLYGDRPAREQQVRAVLDLDDRLARARPPAEVP